MKSPARFPRVAQIAAIPVATNMSPLPASVKAVCRRPNPPGCSATPAPRKRRDAAPRSGYVRPRWPHLVAESRRGIVQMAEDA
jgi:hypothetical protein